MRNLMIFFAYAATIPVANWMIEHVGHCIPQGPCVIPVGFGLSAPSGVLMVGVALVLRDAIHARMGATAAIGAIAFGAALSAIVAPAALVVASVAAFLVSEILDLAVFAHLRRRSIALAVLASGAIGAAADSAAFLWLAFGSLEFIAGQIVGKIYASAIVALVFLGRSATPASEGA